MKGQRLFVRPIEPGDEAALREFLDSQGDSGPVPACGLLGKLVGNLVSILAMQITPDAVTIDNVLVAKELRRKRIGRAMIDEAEQIAIRMDRTQLVCPDATGASAGAEFLRRTGFTREGARWIREVRTGRTERR
jgi:GNAT superfamily N-acetyltransferase